MIAEMPTTRPAPEQIATDVEMERLAGPIWIFQHDLEHGGVECTPADQTCPALPALQDGRIGQRSKSVGHAALQVRSNRNQSASEGNRGAEQQRNEIARLLPGGWRDVDISQDAGRNDDNSGAT